MASRGNDIQLTGDPRMKLFDTDIPIYINRLYDVAGNPDLARFPVFPGTLSAAAASLCSAGDMTPGQPGGGATQDVLSPPGARLRPGDCTPPPTEQIAQP